LAEKTLEGLMAFFLLAMASITLVDVTGRYLFGAPLPGGYEVVQYLMALTVFAALPLVTRAEAHLTIDLFTSQIPEKFQPFHRGLILAFSAFALALVAWRMTAQAAVMANSDAVSGSLGMPLAPIAYVMAGLGWCSLLVCLTLLFLVMIGKDTSPENNAQMGNVE